MSRVAGWSRIWYFKGLLFAVIDIVAVQQIDKSLLIKIVFQSVFDRGQLVDLILGLPLDIKINRRSVFQFGFDGVRFGVDKKFIDHEAFVVQFF